MLLKKLMNLKKQTFGDFLGVEGEHAHRWVNFRLKQLISLLVKSFFVPLPENSTDCDAETIYRKRYLDDLTESFLNAL